MRKSWKPASIAAALGVSCALAAMALPKMADANTFFANQTGLSCTGCHQPGQEERGPAGLNSAGLAFKSCGYKVGCGSAAPPPPAPPTTESNKGLATFHNNCPAGQPRWIIVRAGRNEADRDVVLILEPGQNVKAVVSRGSTFSGQCNAPPRDSGQFSWIRIDQVI